jgi:hypothetical protein|tara:strand:+ start:3469 stop:3684 length:216 start_codon:yes stop_codon:yes gene_type:complete
MTSHFKIFAFLIVLPYVAISLTMSGCSALQEKHDSLLIPPDVIGDDQLICSSENMTLCSGFLTQKDIDKEK